MEQFGQGSLFRINSFILVTKALGERLQMNDLIISPGLVVKVKINGCGRRTAQSKSATDLSLHILDKRTTHERSGPSRASSHSRRKRRL